MVHILEMLPHLVVRYVRKLFRVDGEEEKVTIRETWALLILCLIGVYTLIKWTWEGIYRGYLRIRPSRPSDTIVPEQAPNPPSRPSDPIVPEEAPNPPPREDDTINPDEGPNPPPRADGTTDPEEVPNPSSRAENTFDREEVGNQIALIVKDREIQDKIFGFAKVFIKAECGRHCMQNELQLAEALLKEPSFLAGVEEVANTATAAALTKRTEHMMTMSTVRDIGEEVVGAMVDEAVKCAVSAFDRAVEQVQADLKEEKQAMHTRFEAIEAHLSGLQETNQHLQGQVDTLEQERENVASTIQEKVDEAIRTQVNTFKQENDDLAFKFQETVDQANIEIRTELATLERKNKQLASTLEEKVEQANIEIRTAVDTPKREKEELASTVKKMVDDAKTEIQTQLESTRTSLAEVTNQNTAVKNQLRELKNVNGTLQDRLATTEQALQEAQASNDALTTSSDGLRKDNARLSTDINNLTEQVSDASSTMQAQVAHVEGQTAKYRQELEASNAEVARLLSSVNGFKKENQTLKDQIGSLQQEAQNSQEDIDVKIDKIRISVQAELRDSLENTNRTIDQLSASLAEARTENDKLQQKMHELEQENQNYSTLLNDQVQGLDKLQGEQRATHSKVEDLAQSVSALRNSGAGPVGLEQAMGQLELTSDANQSDQQTTVAMPNDALEQSNANTTSAQEHSSQQVNPTDSPQTPVSVSDALALVKQVTAGQPLAPPEVMDSASKLFELVNSPTLGQFKSKEPARAFARKNAPNKEMLAVLLKEIDSWPLPEREGQEDKQDSDSDGESKKKQKPRRSDSEHPPKDVPHKKDDDDHDGHGPRPGGSASGVTQPSSENAGQDSTGSSSTKSSDKDASSSTKPSEKNGSKSSEKNDTKSKNKKKKSNKSKEASPNSTLTVPGPTEAVKSSSAPAADVLQSSVAAVKSSVPAVVVDSSVPSAVVQSSAPAVKSSAPALMAEVVQSNAPAVVVNSSAPSEVVQSSAPAVVADSSAPVVQSSAPAVVADSSAPAVESSAPAVESSPPAEIVQSNAPSEQERKIAPFPKRHKHHIAPTSAPLNAPTQPKAMVFNAQPPPNAPKGPKGTSSQSPAVRAQRNAERKAAKSSLSRPTSTSPLPTSPGSTTFAQGMPQPPATPASPYHLGQSPVASSAAHSQDMAMTDQPQDFQGEPKLADRDDIDMDGADEAIQKDLDIDMGDVEYSMPEEHVHMDPVDDDMFNDYDAEMSDFEPPTPEEHVDMQYGPVATTPVGSDTSSVFTFGESEANMDTTAGALATYDFSTDSPQPIERGIPLALLPVGDHDIVPEEERLKTLRDNYTLFFTAMAGHDMAMGLKPDNLDNKIRMTVMARERDAVLLSLKKEEYDSDNSDLVDQLNAVIDEPVSTTTLRAVMGLIDPIFPNFTIEERDYCLATADNLTDEYAVVKFPFIVAVGKEQRHQAPIQPNSEELSNEIRDETVWQFLYYNLAINSTIEKRQRQGSQKFFVERYGKKMDILLSDREVVQKAVYHEWICFDAASVMPEPRYAYEEKKEKLTSRWEDLHDSDWSIEDWVQQCNDAASHPRFNQLFIEA